MINISQTDPAREALYTETRKLSTPAALDRLAPAWLRALGKLLTIVLRFSKGGDLSRRFIVCQAHPERVVLTNVEAAYSYVRCPSLSPTQWQDIILESCR